MYGWVVLGAVQRGGRASFEGRPYIGVGMTGIGGVWETRGRGGSPFLWGM